MTKMEVREQARTMRMQGESISVIASALGAAKSSVSEWVRDIELTEEQAAALQARQRHNAGQGRGSAENRKRHYSRRERYQNEGRMRARQGDPLHLMGCMLYWAEGAKKRNSVYFVNSDPEMHRLFMRFLRYEFGVQPTDCSIYIQTHADKVDDIRQIEDYWLALLDLPSSCLRKTHIKRSSGVRLHKLNKGICGLAVHRSWIAQHIYGAIQEYGGFERPAWLA